MQKLCVKLYVTQQRTLAGEERERDGTLTG